MPATTYTRTIAGEATTTSTQSLPTNFTFPGPRPWVDVRDVAYGATGNGVTNDATAIQNAINSLPSTGGTVFIPPGSYALSTGLTLPSRVHLVGAGAGWNWSLFSSLVTANRYVTELKWIGAAGSTMISLANLTTDAKLQGVALNGNAIGTMTAISVVNSMNNQFEEIGISEVVTGISITSATTLSNSAFNLFDAIRMTSVTDGIVLSGQLPVGAGTGSVTHNRFTDITIRDYTGDGIRFVRAADTNNFSMVHLSDNGASARGIVYNTDSVAANREVYNNNFFMTSIDQNVSGSKSIVVNQVERPSLFSGWFGGGFVTVPEINTGGRLIWTRTDTDTGGNAMYFSNNIPINWLSTAAAGRRGLIFDSSNIFYVGDANVSMAISGNAVGFFATTPAAQQVSGANLTNNVATGGTDNTIANFTDLTVYANDAAAIRNDIYQLARKLKQVNDALRLYGLLT